MSAASEEKLRVNRRVATFSGAEVRLWPPSISVPVFQLSFEATKRIAQFEALLRHDSSVLSASAEAAGRWQDFLQDRPQLWKHELIDEEHGLTVTFLVVAAEEKLSIFVAMESARPLPNPFEEMPLLEGTSFKILDSTGEPHQAQMLGNSVAFVDLPLGQVRFVELRPDELAVVLAGEARLAGAGLGQGI